MKKRTTIPRVKDQVLTPIYPAKPRAEQNPEPNFYAAPASCSTRRRISYIPGAVSRKEPVDLPRLFIRGFGGSIKMDLRGIGVGLSEGSFAFQVPNENLQSLHIHRGDIAVVDPGRPILKTGNLILLGLDGRETLGRVERRHRIWWVKTMDDALPGRIPLTNQPLYGVVVGCVRLFTALTPVSYGGTEANFKPLQERSGKDFEHGRLSRRRDAKPSRSGTRYAKKKRAPFLLVSESKSPFCLSEVKTDQPYSA